MAAVTPEAIERQRERCRLYEAKQREIARGDGPEAERLRAKRVRENSRRIAQNRALIAEYKASGCVDCGRTDLPPEVLDLDHVRGERVFGLAQARNRGSQAVKDELAKCDVRCPTCHALRHYNERTQPHGRLV